MKSPISIINYKASNIEESDTKKVTKFIIGIFGQSDVRMFINMTWRYGENDHY